MAPSQNTRSRVQSPAPRKPTAMDQVQAEKPGAIKAPLKPVAVQIPAAPAPAPKAPPAKEASGMSKTKAVLVVVAAVALVACAVAAIYKADLPWDKYKAIFEAQVARVAEAVSTAREMDLCCFKTMVKTYASEASAGFMTAYAEASVSFKTAYAHAVTKAKAEPLLAGTAAAVAALPMVFLLAKKAAGMCRKPKTA